MKVEEKAPQRWYVVYTCPNSEKKIYKELSRRKINAFLPIKTEVRQWWDRKKKLEVPLFPNYVFVNVSLKEIWTVLMVNGVVRLISFDGVPAVVKDAEIDMIKQLSSVTNKINNENGCIKGEKVQVKEGPLSGLMGKVKDMKGTTRLFVELETIHQVISVDIETAFLEKVG